MPEQARINIRQEGDSVIIVGGGTLDLTNSKDFSEGLKHASQTAEDVTVDLREADFIDTQIVHDLAKAAVTLLKRGKRLKVIASEVRYPLRVLRISGFEGIMDIEVEPAVQQA